MQKLPVMWDTKNRPPQGTGMLLLSQPCLPAAAAHRQQGFQPRTISTKPLDEGVHSAGGPSWCRSLSAALAAPQASSSSHAHTSSINISAGQALRSEG